jgi:hypothetical protein
VIDAELGREDHSSIPQNCDRMGTETTWTILFGKKIVTIEVKKIRKEKVIINNLILLGLESWMISCNEWLVLRLLVVKPCCEWEGDIFAYTPTIKSVNVEGEI